MQVQVKKITQILSLRHQLIWCSAEFLKTLPKRPNPNFSLT